MLQYPWQPYKTLRSDYDDYVKLFRTGVSSLDNIDELIRSACGYSLDSRLVYQINDIIHLSIQNGLKHTTNRETLALARDRIPSGA